MKADGWISLNLEGRVGDMASPHPKHPCVLMLTHKHCVRVQTHTYIKDVVYTNRQGYALHSKQNLKYQN